MKLGSADRRERRANPHRAGLIVAGALAVVLTIFSGALIATFWRPLDARLAGYELSVGGYDRQLGTGFYRYGGGGAFILEVGGQNFKIGMSRSRGP